MKTLFVATPNPFDIKAPLRAKGNSPPIAYFAVTGLALMAITLTEHLGGILSGVETP